MAAVISAGQLLYLDTKMSSSENKLEYFDIEHCLFPCDYCSCGFAYIYLILWACWALQQLAFGKNKNASRLCHAFVVDA